MKGSEFLRKIKTLGKERGIKVELVQRRGKGSHSTLIYGTRFTIIRNLKDELKTGTYKAMLKQLGIDEDELKVEHMNTLFDYPVYLIKQKGGYLVQFPDFPEAITQGNTVDEALKEAVDCLEEAIANRIEMKLDIPAPSLRKKKQYYVSLNTTFVAKVGLYMAMREQKLTNTALAKKLKCDEKEIRRLLDPHYRSKLPRLEHALMVLGKRLQIKVVASR